MLLKLPTKVPLPIVHTGLAKVHVRLRDPILIGMIRGDSICVTYLVVDKVAKNA